MSNTETATVPVDPVVDITERILHTLMYYPKISPTMLQVGIGTTIAPNLWKPVLEQLILDNAVVRTYNTIEGPGGRYRTLIVLQLGTIPSVAI